MIACGINGIPSSGVEESFPKMPEGGKNILLASTFYEQLERHIRRAQEELNHDEQILVRVPLETGDPLTISHIGFEDPNLLALIGEDAQGNDCTVLCQMHSVRFTVMKVKTLGPNRESINFIGERTTKPKQ